MSRLLRKFPKISLFYRLNKLIKSKHSSKSAVFEMQKNNVNKTENKTKPVKPTEKPTTRGIIAVKYDPSHAIILELNCETDAALKNNKFLTLAKEAAEACFKFTHTTIVAKGPLTKMCLDSERLRNLHTDKGEVLSKHFAATIESIGEKIVLQRAECFKAAPGTVLVGYVEPPSNASVQIAIGKTGAVLAYTCENKSSDVTSIGKDLCKLVVLKNPTRIGSEKFDRKDDEECFIFQKYSTNPDVVVNDVLNENKIHLIDFIRFDSDHH